MKKITALVLSAAMMVPVTASARDFASIYTDCGIGGMLFSSTPVGAVISNIIWDLGTTASSSQLSSPDSCKGGQATAAAFIVNSYANLSEETIKGDGEHLAALMGVVGCDGAASAVAIDAMRADFSVTLGSDGYQDQTHYEKSEAFFDLLNEHTGGSCNVVS